MKHAGADTIARLTPLLEELRKRPALREKRPGIFYLKSRAFLHFHEDPTGIFADVRLEEDFTRLPSTQRAHWKALLKRIDERLES